MANAPTDIPPPAHTRSYCSIAAADFCCMTIYMLGTLSPRRAASHAVFADRAGAVPPAEGSSPEAWAGVALSGRRAASTASGKGPGAAPLVLGAAEPLLLLPLLLDAGTLLTGGPGRSAAVTAAGNAAGTGLSAPPLPRLLARCAVGAAATATPLVNARDGGAAPAAAAAAAAGAALPGLPSLLGDAVPDGARPGGGARPDVRDPTPRPLAAPPINDVRECMALSNVLRSISGAKLAPLALLTMLMLPLPERTAAATGAAAVAAAGAASS